MEDPVISPEGISYEKENIINWLKTNKVEPTTKRYLEERLLYPNLVLRNLIDQFR